MYSNDEERQKFVTAKYITEWRCIWNDRRSYKALLHAITEYGAGIAVIPAARFD
jgi:hypothetical protein